MSIHLLTALPQRRMISGMHGQNYWFNGCMAYLMEYLGENPAYDYWFFSDVTGDSFVQVHGGDPRRMTLCYSDVMTADAVKRAFCACGYAFGAK